MVRLLDRRGLNFMAAQSTLGIAIQRVPFSESSQVVHFLTRDNGRLVCMARGVFRPKSGLHGGIDLLTLNRITL
ncbi:MAG: hypothetical protein C4574_01355, partial [Candidatus Latescibacterota bacterium]